MQVEYYPEPLLGYDLNLKGFGLPGKYLAWTEDNWSLTAGDFYDQFGTGVIFRILSMSSSRSPAMMTASMFFSLSRIF